MRNDSKKRLSDDLLADSLAHSRQRLRWGKAALVSTVLLACATSLYLHHLNQSEDQIQITSKSSERNPLAPNTEAIDEFDPLLDLLADAGPIIITLPNGDRELILTK